MKQHRQLKTSKLFYNKWPYKLVLVVDGAYFVNREKCAAVIKRCNDPIWGNNRYQSINKEDLSTFCEKFQQFENTNTQKRSEHNSLSVFCDDIVLLDNMIQEMQPWVYEIWKPESDADLKFLTSTTAKKVVCDALPYEKFRYRVRIKSMTDLNTRANFANWINNYQDKTSISGHTKKWFYSGKGGYGWNPFLYVEDTATLSMVGLFLGNNISSTEEFVLRSSINTSLEEQQCQP